MSLPLPLLHTCTYTHIAVHCHAAPAQHQPAYTQPVTLMHTTATILPLSHCPSATLGNCTCARGVTAHMSIGRAYARRTLQKTSCWATQLHFPVWACPPHSPPPSAPPRLPPRPSAGGRHPAVLPALPGNWGRGTALAPVPSADPVASLSGISPVSPARFPIPPPPAPVHLQFPPPIRPQLAAAACPELHPRPQRPHRAPHRLAARPAACSVRCREQ